MKNFLLVLFVASATFFGSCNKDEEATKIDTSASIIGAWRYDRDPGYGDPTFFENNRVNFKYFKPAWNDDFTESGTWTKDGNNLVIRWDPPTDPGKEVYRPTIIELSSTKLRWDVMIDGKLIQYTFTRK